MDEWLSEELHKYEDGDRTDMDENIRTTNICCIYLNHEDTFVLIVVKCLLTFISTQACDRKHK